MKIGIIGSGAVAQALGSGFLKHGPELMMGTRTSSHLAEWWEQHPNANIGGVADAARFGDLLVLAVKGANAMNALLLAGADNLADKKVIDVTNPIAEGPPVNGVLRFYTSLDESQLERLQHAFPRVRFVKAFNSVGAAHMVNPQFNGVRPTMFICGNDETAKKSVCHILEQFGWEAADMGRVEAARAIEPLCMLWCIPGFLHNDWEHAFKLLT